jgi:L-threonate 2-dehydrogenase
MPGTTTVGIIGVGTMGLPIAGNLVDSGFPVVGYRRSAMPAEFLALGGTALGSAAEVAQQAEVVLTILPGPDALRQVVCGPDGLLAGARPGQVFVELSTVPVAVKRECRDALAGRGAELLDAPISGMPSMVAARAATLFASGDEAAFAQVRAVLEAITPRVHLLGAFGSGSATKFVAHLLLALHNLAAAEAVGLARRAGMELEPLLEVLSGTIAQSAVLAARGPMMISGRFRPAPGPVDTLFEGLEQVDAFARELDAPTPMLELALHLYAEARADGRGADDIAVMVQHIAHRTDPT